MSTKEKSDTVVQAREAGLPDHGRHGIAEARLAELGYQQELTRSLGMVSILGLSMAIMAVPFGTSTTLSVALTTGGPVVILWGWIFVSCVSMAMAASLAEICSVYPTSGGVYYWSACLSTPEWAPAASYMTGWLGLIGNWTVTTSINFGGAQLILTAITLWDEEYVPTAWQTVLLYWLCLLLAMSINIFFNRYIDKMNTLCLYWTGASVIMLWAAEISWRICLTKQIMIVLLVKCPDLHSAKYAFTEFDASPSGWPAAWSWFVGLLQGAYTLTGYGMVASLCEEVENPEREVPRAMVLSVAAAGITGVAYLLPINFVLPDIPTLLSVASGQPMPLLFKMVTGSAAGGFGLLFLILGIWAFAAIGSLTAACRCTWAFSRDGAIPGSGIWKRVNHRFEVPLNSLYLSTAVCALLGLIYLGSSAAFAAFTGVATICLGMSYAFPVLCSLLRRRKLVKGAPFSLGRFGYFINIVTVVWITFSIILFCMPTAIPVLPTTVNYASVVFVGFLAIAAGWYLVWGRKHYKGPAVSMIKVRSDSTGHSGDSGVEKVPSKA